MKLLLLLTFFFLCTTVSATDYYISASGNDANTGLSTSTSWKTITKVNSAFANIKPGDQILFNRGDTFYGSLVISKSGTSDSPITIGAYGSGNNPILSGLTTLASWTDNGNGIFYSALDVPRLNIVTLNGVAKGMGRFPNTGYLNYETHNAKLSITDNQLTGTPNWSGAEIGIRKYRWIIDRHTVTNQTNGTLTYSSDTNYGNATYYEPLDGNGYFLQNHIGCLDDLGDWCYNAAEKRVYMYFGGSIPSNYLVKAGNIQSGVTINSRSNIDFINIDFEGANIDGINIIGSNHINLTNCNLTNQGGNSLYGINCDYIAITGGSINNTLNNGIFFEWNVNEVTINGLSVSNAGNILGASKSGDATATGMYISGTNLTVKNCNVSNIGYNAISFNGDNALVENNIVSNFCTLKDDGGGIYTYNGTGAVIRNNIILNAIGAYAGSESAYWEPFGKCAGIYLDNGVSNHNATVSGNTVANGDFTGIFINNNGGNSLLNNTVYNFKQYQLLIYGYTSGNIRNTTITGNQFISKTSTQKVLYNQLFLNENPSLFGTINNNYYACPIDDNLTIQTSINGNTIINRTLAQWQSYSGQDASSQKSPVAINDTSSISFYYNETKINKTIVLAVPMVDVKGTKYINNIELLPFTSVVLMVDPSPDLPIIPIFVSATIENATSSLIVMTCNLSLANSVPATSAFTVLVNSAARAVNAVAISGTKVQLTLASPIAFGDVVTVDYTKPALNPLQTTSAGLAASITAQAVTNSINPPVPVFVSSTVGNATPSLIEMTYDLGLANIVPATSAFTVLVNSAARTVSSVAITGTKVQLTLASAIAFGDVVTVSYTKPTASPLQTTFAGQAASISAQAVTNSINPPVPVFVSSTVGNPTPSLIEMTYDLGLANIVPATSAFTVLVNSAARAVNTVAISGTKVQLTLASAIAFGDLVTVDYTRPALSPLQTTSAGQAASITAQAVTNNISAPVPVYASAAVRNTTPSLIEMTYNLSMANIVPATSAFTVFVNSAARAVNTVAISGTKVQLTLAGAIAFGDVVTVAYMMPAVSPLQTIPAGQAASITAQAVTNNVSAPVPVYASAAVGNTTPSMIEMTYNLGLANIAPATSAFSVLVNSAARAVNAVAISGTKVQLTLASAIAFGDVVTVAYSKPLVSPLQTSSAGMAASVTAQAVTNNISAPVPVYVSAAVGNITPSLIEMTYDLSLANIVPATSAFTVQVNSIARMVNAVTISGTKVQLTLSGSVLYGDVVIVAYIKPSTNGIQNSYGGQAVSITARDVTNNVVRLIPTYVNSVIENANPSLLQMTYNLSLAIKRPAASAFSVKVNSTIKRVKSVNISGNKVLLTLANAVVYGDVITVAYTKPSMNPLQTTSAVFAVSISSQQVTNNCLKMRLKDINPILALTNDTVIYSETAGNFKALDNSELEKRKITIYPNPAYTFFNISFDEPTMEPQILKIIDLSGKVVLTDLIEQGLQNIQIPLNYKTGYYIVTVESSKKNIFTQKLIIHQ